MKYLLNIALLASACALPQSAVAQDTTRYSEIRPEQLSPAQKQFIDNAKAPPRNANVNTGPYQVYLRSPEFGLRAVAMSDYLRWGTSLEPRLIEFTILIAARQWSSSYIWRAHYPPAIKGGLDPRIPAAMAAGQRPQGMKADEAIIYDLLTQIYRDKSVSDATFNAAVARYGEKGVTDIIGLASYYGITAMALITAKAPTAPGDEPKLQAMAQVFPK
ncbi:MAG: carboxymuconolactone decarboxylase [Anaerolineales bacterium]|nr:carboxymuconolactone decarboxylase [Anaerolineales bacterium]